ncbi:hypothetical protein VPHD479_0165 [Vibrio phage D479]
MDYVNSNHFKNYLCIYQQRPTLSQQFAPR